MREVIAGGKGMGQKNGLFSNKDLRAMIVPLLLERFL